MSRSGRRPRPFLPARRSKQSNSSSLIWFYDMGPLSTLPPNKESVLSRSSKHIGRLQDKPSNDNCLSPPSKWAGGTDKSYINWHVINICEYRPLRLWRVTVGFQTEITPFPPIDGVGHQSLSLVKTLSVLSLSLLFESPRCQDLLVRSSFSFQEVFHHSPRVPLFLKPQRGSGTFVFHYYVNCILSLFMFCGMFSPQIYLSSKVDSRVSL